MSNDIRTFIAVELEDKVRQELGRIQASFKKLPIDVKWVKPDNIHITLKFFGDTNPKKVKTIIETLPKLFEGIVSCEIPITHLGAFPKIQRPKVVWAGLDDPEGRIKTLSQRVEDGLAVLGVGKEKREFSSHITLGRVRSFKNLNMLSQALKDTSLPSNLNLKIEKITFFKSTLTSQGPIYESLLTHLLK